MERPLEHLLHVLRLIYYAVGTLCIPYFLLYSLFWRLTDFSAGPLFLLLLITVCFFLIGYSLAARKKWGRYVVIGFHGLWAIGFVVEGFITGLGNATPLGVFMASIAAGILVLCLHPKTKVLWAR